MKNIGTLIGAIALVIAVTALFFPKAGMVVSEELGNKTASFWDAVSYKVSGTEVISSSRTATFTSLVLSNSSTSTVSVGCIQTTATSSATPIKLTFNVSFVGTSTLNGDGTAAGNVTWDYGTCP